MIGSSGSRAISPESSHPSETAGRVPVGVTECGRVIEAGDSSAFSRASSSRPRSSTSSATGRPVSRAVAATSVANRMSLGCGVAALPVTKLEPTEAEQAEILAHAERQKARRQAPRFAVREQEGNQLQMMPTGVHAEVAGAGLMNALRPRPPFQVLVMSEGSRLGREQIQTAYLPVRCVVYTAQEYPVAHDI